MCTKTPLREYYLHQSTPSSMLLQSERSWKYMLMTWKNSIRDSSTNPRRFSSPRHALYSFSQSSFRSATGTSTWSWAASSGCVSKCSQEYLWSISKWRGFKQFNLLHPHIQLTVKIYKASTLLEHMVKKNKSSPGNMSYSIFGLSVWVSGHPSTDGCKCECASFPRWSISALCLSAFKTKARSA